MHAPDETSTDMPIPMARPITAYSRDKYTAMIKSLERHSSAIRTKDVTAPAQVDPLVVTQDLLARTDLSKASRRIYRSAMVWYLRQEQDQSPLRRRAYALLMDMPRKGGRTAKSLRPSCISEEDFDLLIGQVASRADRSDWARRTQNWLHATMATGVRPIEWLDAEWADDSHIILKVVTAKNKVSPPAFRSDGSVCERDPSEENEDEQQRYLPNSVHRIEYGPVREIPITRTSDRLFVEAHMASVAAEVPRGLGPEERLAEFTRYFNQCRQLLWRACDKIWHGKKTFSLYTMRKQFSANQKAAVGSVGAATLLGHSDASSPAAAYYGKANQAHARFKGLRPGSRPEDWVERPSQHLDPGADAEAA